MNDDIAEALKDFLTELNIEVTVTSSFTDFCKWMSSSAFDYVLLDYAIGEKTIETLIEMCKGKKVPKILLMTTKPHLDHLIEKYEITGVFRKPFDIKELEEKLK